MIDSETKKAALNAIWHDVSEMPDKNGEILVWDRGTNYCEKTYHIVGSGGDEGYLRTFTKWAYIDDLLPKP